MREKISSSALVFMSFGLIMLIFTFLFGLFSCVIYIEPTFLKDFGGFSMLRPLHVSSALFWILLSAIGGVYYGLSDLGSINKIGMSTKWMNVQLLLWVVAIVGIFYSYLNQQYGGREYWEFNPVWSIPIIFSWIIFLVLVIRVIRKIEVKPIYLWMWATGGAFFLFSFIENYLWVFPYFRSDLVKDIAIQWKANGALVGAWNQLIYGISFFLLEKITGRVNKAKSRMVFSIYLLGLINLMFNWSHHIYILPLFSVYRWVGYLVSMTEWIIFIRIIYLWKKELGDRIEIKNRFDYIFLNLADVWVVANLFLALLMSIPAINLYTHGTHITVAHAMGTTIGINSMILLALNYNVGYNLHIDFEKYRRLIKTSVGVFQLSFFLFWIILIGIGVYKGIWQKENQFESFSSMMSNVKIAFLTLVICGSLMVISIVPIISFPLFAFISYLRKI